MGDAAAKRRERTAARLREAAKAAFAELGWNATRVEDIVQRAEVSHGTFYTYYPNKSAALADLVRGTRDELVRLAADPWEAEDVRGALERVLAGFIDVYQRDGVVLRTWLQAARDEPEFGELYRTTRERFVQRVGENVDLVIEASGRRPGSFSRAVASALVAMVEHFSYTSVLLGEQHSREDMIEAAVLIWGSSLNALAGFEVVRLP